MEIKPVFYSDAFKKLKGKFEEAASILKGAIDASAPIVIRHHGDGDGYCAGIAIEQALLEVQENNYGRPTVTRYPLRAPKYELCDAVADLRTCSNPKFRNKRPIVVILDNGSTTQDEAALRLLKLYRIDAIVVDHHPIDKIDETLRKVHINAYLVGGNGDYTAGMLAVELANLINSGAHVKHLAALSGVSDKVSGEWLEGYLKVAELNGYTLKKLQELYLALDYMISFRMESYQLLRDLLIGEHDNQEKLIKLFAGEGEKLREDRLNVLRENAKFKGSTAIVDIGALMTNFYPAPGRSVGLLYQELKKKDEKALVLGYGPHFLTIRGILPQGLTVTTLIEKLKAQFQNVDGGGHDVAGTIHFLPIDKEKVQTFVNKLIN